MYDAYREQAAFLTVYIKEAHPTDEWQMSSNERDGVCYPQPRTLDDRIAIVRDFTARYSYRVPMLVDRTDNAADEAYAAWPERLYVIDERGIVAYKGAVGPFGYEPEEVERWLAARFKP